MSKAIIEEILEKYKEFSSYLDTIDINVLKDKYTRKELMEFSEALRIDKLRSLWYEVHELTKEMKLKEFPELLGVHRFPILKEIDFMTEEEKIELDKKLVGFNVGHYLPYLGRYTNEHKKLEQFLLENNVVEKQYVVTCPCCGGNEWLSNTLDTKTKEAFDELLTKEIVDDCDDVEAFTNIVDRICDECDFYPELESMRVYKAQNQLRYKELLQMNMKRNTSLDNV
ncbi:hypothetical protein [Bacillus thuringiensis]|uniref:Uncharacterized protein n=1 Tax=Bacillus thuringiensis TaxID=1428 RepID=A0A9X7BTA8_BACTU|nr:hypothetical protein [Bacillus thuringiensis]PFV35773.1 hypothetical protein COK99_01755 [Bacillus thuringiensis]